jgi:hypothetical protein
MQGCRINRSNMFTTLYNKLIQNLIFRILTLNCLMNILISQLSSVSIYNTQSEF